MFGDDKWEAPDRHFAGHRDTYVRNMSRYHFIAPQLKGRFLDIGCGRGYGFSYLQGNCPSCTGLDVSEDFLREARARYPDVRFLRQNAERLPFGDQSFDSITAFEVIEHIENDKAFLREIRRVASPGAIIAISTPNRRISSGNRKRPLNRFHVREYEPKEFRDLLQANFAEVILYGQSEGSGSKKGSFAGSMIDRIPLRLKYLLPVYLQNLLSVMLRPPLQMDDCYFEPEKFECAHTLYAICRVAGAGRSA
jgi:SAM-dependent methyltransferase